MTFVGSGIRNERFSRTRTSPDLRSGATATMLAPQAGVQCLCSKMRSGMFRDNELAAIRRRRLLSYPRGGRRQALAQRSASLDRCRHLTACFFSVDAGSVSDWRFIRSTSPSQEAGYSRTLFQDSPSHLCFRRPRISRRVRGHGLVCLDCGFRNHEPWPISPCQARGASAHRNLRRRLSHLQGQHLVLTTIVPAEADAEPRAGFPETSRNCL